MLGYYFLGIQDYVRYGCIIKQVLVYNGDKFVIFTVQFIGICILKGKLLKFWDNSLQGGDDVPCLIYS